MLTPDQADRYARLPEEALIVYGMLRESLGRDLTDLELEDFLQRHGARNSRSTPLPESQP